MLTLRDPGRTDPLLLRHLANWSDYQNWSRFIEQYEPFVYQRCRRYGLDDSLTLDLCQLVWVELAQRIENFEYDPSRSFRAWLARLCHFRALDLIRKRQLDATLSLPQGFDPIYIDPIDDATHDLSLDLLEEAEQFQNLVKQRVDARTWRIFWDIVVMGNKVEDVASREGLTYYATFAAKKRILKMFREIVQKRQNAT